MMMDFSIEALEEFGPMSRVNSLRFDRCVVLISPRLQGRTARLCNIEKFNEDQETSQIYGPFDYFQPLWKVKALIQVFHDDEFNRHNLAKFVAMRMLHEG